MHFIQLTIFCKKKRAPAFNRDRWCHLALCLWLILFHWPCGLEGDKFLRKNWKYFPIFFSRYFSLSFFFFSLCLSSYLTVCLSFFLFICLSLSFCLLSVCFSFFLPVPLSFYLFLFLSACSSFFLSDCLSLPIFYFSVYLYISISFYLPVSLFLPACLSLPLYFYFPVCLYLSPFFPSLELQIWPNVIHAKHIWVTKKMNKSRNWQIHFFCKIFWIFWTFTNTPNFTFVNIFAIYAQTWV